MRSAKPELHRVHSILIANSFVETGIPQFEDKEKIYHNCISTHFTQTESASDSVTFKKSVLMGNLDKVSFFRS